MPVAHAYRVLSQHVRKTLQRPLVVVDGAANERHDALAAVLIGAVSQRQLVSSQKDPPHHTRQPSPYHRAQLPTQTAHHDRLTMATLMPLVKWLAPDGARPCSTDSTLPLSVVGDDSVLTLQTPQPTRTAQRKRQHRRANT